MTHYSSPETNNRAKDLVSLLQAKLAGVGIKSEVTSNWYSYALMVQDPEPYRAVSIHESADKGCLVVCFETLRLSTDGEILYRGVNIEENPEAIDDLIEEAKRQNDWAKRRQERSQSMQQKAQLSDAALQRLREDYPGHARDIRVHSQYGCTFNLILTGVTEERIREILKVTELGVDPVDPVENSSNVG
jgi:hypothetical protein